MLSNLTIPEVIAYLDVLEDNLRTQADSIREYRYMLFETLDTDPEALVD